MIILTPDVTYNTCQYRSIWTNGIDPCVFLMPVIGSEPDRILFDSVDSAIQAFDTIVNAELAGVRLLTIREKITENGNNELVTTKDEEYRTVTTENNDCRIADPRKWDENQRAFIICKSATVS